LKVKLIVGFAIAEHDVFSPFQTSIERETVRTEVIIDDRR
jgi:hypothetical protein